jgi:GNAT superfamily N-acetyltransferase
MTAPSIGYRLAMSEDLPALAALRLASDLELRGGTAWPDDREAFLAVYSATTRAGMDEGTVLAWLAEDVGQAVACAQLRWWAAPTVHRAGRCRGYVTGVYTRPEYRRQGIARHLMELLVAWARDHEVTRLLLSPSEVGAQLYRELGFTEGRGLELDL